MTGHQKYDSGLLWKLNDIFSHHIDNSKERQRLMLFCHSRIFLVEAELEKAELSLAHKIISKLPDELIHQETNKIIMKTLIRAECDMIEPNASGDPPLLAGIKAYKSGVVDAFLDMGSHLNVVDRDWKTCLIYAAENNDQVTVKKLLQIELQNTNSVHIDVTDKSQRNALSYAAHNDSVIICKLLLDAGADPNFSIPSPVFLAIWNNCSLETISILVKRGALVNACIESSGFNTLMAAACKNRTDVVELLVNSGAHFPTTWYTNQAFMTALEKDNIDVVNLFLSKGVYIHCNNHKGSNILHVAAAMGSEHILQYLVDNTDIDLNKCDRYGKTAFYLSAESGHSKCMEVLFLAGASGWTREQNGLSPLDAAIFQNHTRCVLFIVSHAVCPRRKLVSTLQVLERDYDQVVFGRMNAMKTFKSHMAELDGHIDNLFVLSIINIQSLLGQRSWEKVKKLPLPKKITDLIFARTLSKLTNTE